jgi:hypothetical protein
LEEIGDAMITSNWILGKLIVKMVNGCITSGCALGKEVVKITNRYITSECSLVSDFVSEAMGILVDKM